MQINKQYFISGNRLVTYIGEEDHIDFITGEPKVNAKFELVNEPGEFIHIQKELVADRVLTLDEFDGKNKHYSYPSIGQPRQLIREVIERQQYEGRDEKGKAIYNKAKPLDELIIQGTVKLDGANCSVVLTKDGDLYAQSRTILLNRVDDVYGFNTFFEEHREYFKQRLSADLDDNYAVVVYGEWVGRNNTQTAAMKDVDNIFVIFDLYTIKEDERVSAVDSNKNRTPQPIAKAHIFSSFEKRIYTIDQFQTWRYKITADKFYMINNKLVELTEEVEKECPVAKHFGFTGIGEGIVWTCTCNGKKFRMKVKGAKHSVSNVEVLQRIDPKTIQLRTLIDATVTTPRLKQGLDYLQIGGLELTKTNAGKFMQWVIDDIIKEESEDLDRLGVDRKTLLKEASSKIANWYHTNI